HIAYNEGFNAYHALAAWHGKLYGSTFTPLNYPPLSFCLLRLFPDPLMAGRFIALLSLFLCCIFVSVIVYETTRDMLASILSGLLTLSIFLGIAEFYVGMNDPQLLAQAVMLGSFLMYLLRKN